MTLRMSAYRITAQLVELTGFGKALQGSKELAILTRLGIAQDPAFGLLDLVYIHLVLECD